jgi:CRP-like cAMP-binding protein
MEIDALYNALSAYHSLSRDLKAEIEQEVDILTLPKNYCLIQAPKVPDFGYFLLDGFVMAYTFYKGKKQVDAFYKPGEFAFPLPSFFLRSPSRNNLQLMTESQVCFISYEATAKFLRDFQEANKLFQKIVIQCYQGSQTRLDEMRRLTAQERYLKLLSDYPKIEQLVAQEDIASYLSITPQSLSRIRRTMH